MRINCPHCGDRDVSEFTYLGDATLTRPNSDIAPSGEAQADAFHDYVYLRDNPEGTHREHWYHGMGCRAWLTVTRNIRSHAVLSVVSAGKEDRL